MNIDLKADALGRRNHDAGRLVTKRDAIDVEQGGVGHLSFQPCRERSADNNP